MPKTTLPGFNPRAAVMTAEDDPNLLIRHREHTDWEMITLLPKPTMRGLQFQDDDGKWHDAVLEDNSILINAGDDRAAYSELFSLG